MAFPLEERGYHFLYLPARSREPLCLPHGIELILPSLFHNGNVSLSYSLTTPKISNIRERNRPCHRTDAPQPGVSIYDSTDLDLRLKPTQRFKKTVIEMQRQSRKETIPSKKPVSLVRSASARPSNAGYSGLRTDGGRASLRASKGRKPIVYDSFDLSKNKIYNMDPALLLRENIELKHRLEDEETKYERRLDIYRQGQQHQAALVSRLQSKVLQYKKRCSDLENQVKEIQPVTDSYKTHKNVFAPPGSALDVAQQHLRDTQVERISDLETALRSLNEERNRCEKLLNLNNILREQLEEAHRTNEALTNDMQSLTSDWQQLRNDMLEKEEEWNEEEQFFDDYYTTEHNRVVNLWKDVLSMKKTFDEMQAATQRDLNKLKNEVTSTSNNMVATCGEVLTQSVKAAAAEKQQEMAKENLETQAKLQSLKHEYDLLVEQSKNKDEQVKTLTKELQKLKEKSSETEGAVEELSQMQEEVEMLLNGLREIAQAVVMDADSKDAGSIQPIPHVHLSSVISSLRIPYQDSGIKIADTSAFVESTISGVHAALHKYQSQIHELQVKLSSQMEQLIAADRQNENNLDTQRKLCKKVSDLNDELDSLKAEINLLGQEKDTLIKSLEAVRIEKEESDKSRNEINSMFEDLNKDYEKLLKNRNKVQQIALNLEEDKNALHNEFDRITKELETRETNSRLIEERYNQMLEELLTIKEELNRTYLDKELVEQHRIEAQTLLVLAEKAKGDVESELQKVLLERSEVNDSLIKMENLAATLEDEKNKLQNDIKKVEEESIKYQNQITELNNDLNAVRKELLNVEQNRLDLEGAKISLIDRCSILESEKEQLESELNRTINERSELNNELVGVHCKKDALNEELLRLRQRIEQVGDTNSRINKHLEDLVKDCEEKQVMLESNEKEITHLRELNALLKSEKDSIEVALFDTQTNLEASEIRKEILEKDQQELLIKQENLKSEIQQLMKDMENCSKQANDAKTKLLQDMKSLENEYKQTIENMKIINDQSVQRINDEKEQIRINLEKKLQLSIEELEIEKRNEVEGLQKKLETLEQHMEIQFQQHEEALKRAENDKQQALLIADQDQNALLEKLDTARIEIEEDKEMIQKIQREANMKTEQDRSNINSLREQITKITAKMEELRIKANDEKCKLTAEIDCVKKERDNQMKECDELKIELALAEDRMHNIKLQLTDTNHKLNEGDKLIETLRKELNELRRGLNESNIEKDKYFASNKELREFVKKSEAEKREQARSIEESNQKLLGLEEKISQLENERSRLQNAYRNIETKLSQVNQKNNSLSQQLDKANSANIQKQNDEKELIMKLNIEIEDREKAQHDLHNYKKQLIETEANLDAYQQEVNKLRQHYKDDEERWNRQISDLLTKLEESRNKEHKLEDDKHNLEICLNDSTQQIQDLKTKLVGAEGRVRALENQISQLESSKREVEQKLKSIGTVFRRLGLVDNLDTSSGLPAFKMRASRQSPGRTKAMQTTRDLSTESAMMDGTFDIDPDAIKRSVRLLLQQIAQIERERDDLNAEITSTKKQLDEANCAEKRNQSKINSMVDALKQSVEEKGILETQLSQKQTALISETQTIMQKEEENQRLRDKLITAELSLKANSEEKIQAEEKISKLRSANNQLETEKQKLKDDLSKAETKVAKLEIQKISLEGDLNRLQIMLQEKDGTIQKLQNRAEHQTNSITNLEDRCTSLKSTIDQLNTSLEFSCSNETDLRSEIENLHKCLADCSATSQSYEDKIKQLQKSINNYENERRLLNERLERSEHMLSDLHKECNIKDEQICRQQLELDSKEIHVVNLQDQLRISKFTTVSEFDEKDSTYKLQIEICELRGRNQMLEERLRRLENEKKNLEHKLSMTRSKTYDKSDITEGFGSTSAISVVGLNLSLLEHENRDLKDKCSQIQAQLIEKEAELARLRARDFSRGSIERSDELERYRAGQLHAEHLLKAREQSHRQQIEHLKSEVSNLRKRLDQELKFRKKYLTESIGESQNVTQLRDALTDSLRTVSQNPSLDALLLDHETRRLNSSVLLAKSNIPRTRSIMRK